MMCFAFRTQALAVWLSIILPACTGESKYEQESLRFSAYLKRTFNAGIPAEKTWYFIIPSSSCTGCQQNALQDLGRLSGKGSVFIVTSSENKLPENFPASRCFSDTSMGLNKLGLGFGGTGLIITQKQAIISILPVTPHNLDSIISSVR